MHPWCSSELKISSPYQVLSTPELNVEAFLQSGVTVLNCGKPFLWLVTSKVDNMNISVAMTAVCTSLTVIV